jgi:low affinity Fe/Cu permease
MIDIFQRISTRVASWMGSSSAFILSCVICVLWALSGPWFGYSDTWQLVINTGTTVATFLMVFLIQNTQNRDAKAIHIKLDELIRGVRGARNSVVSAEELSEKELDHLLAEFRELHEKYEKEITKKGGKRISVVYGE